MENDWTNEQLLAFARDKVMAGRKLISMLAEYQTIPGVENTQSKIMRETRFFEKAIMANTLRSDNIRCSNITHFDFLVKLLAKQRNVVYVDCAFAVKERKYPLRVDIVCENGLVWIKAIARKSKALDEASKGDSGCGARNILDQAQEFVDVSAQHTCLFKRPQVVFYFINEIASSLALDLEAIGVEVAYLHQPFILTEGANIEDIGIVNLDITTLLSYISAICNGSVNWVFRENILSEQAMQERDLPVKPVLEAFFKDKRLICCETAFKSFRNIIEIMAGPQERQRADALMHRVEVLPDVDPLPQELQKIKLSGKITERSLKIFAFGMQHKAVTVTANFACVSSMKMQGINIPVFTHQARALTEVKEATAKPFTCDIDEIENIGL